MCYGETTNEHLRKTYRNRGSNGLQVQNPYNHGYLLNCYSICCIPIQPSLLPVRMSDTIVDLREQQTKTHLNDQFV